MDLRRLVREALPVWGPSLVLAAVLITLLLVVGVWYGLRREHAGSASEASSMEVSEEVLTDDLDAWVQQVARENGLDPEDLPATREMLQQMPRRSAEHLTDAEEVRELLRAHVVQIAQDRTRAQAPAASTP